MSETAVPSPEAKLEAIRNLKKVLKQRQDAILPVLEDHPLRLYRPTGLPVELGGHPDALNGKQYAYHCCNAKERLLTAGNQCLAENTLVRMASGHAYPIECLAPGDTVLSVRSDGTTYPAQVLQVYYNGPRMVRRWSFGKRRTEVALCATSDHRVLMYQDPSRGKGGNRMLPLSETLGRTRMRHSAVRALGFDLPERQEEGLAFIAGLLLGDGYVPEGAPGKWRLTCAEPDLIEEYQPHFRDFGVKLRQNPGNPIQYRMVDIGAKRGQLSIHALALKTRLQDIGVFGLSADKRLPAYSKVWSCAGVARLVAALIATDGSVCKTPEGYCLSFTSISWALTEGLKWLLEARLGVYTSSVIVADRGDHTTYSITISNYQSLKRMSEIVRIPGRKGRNLARAIDAWRGKKSSLARLRVRKPGEEYEALTYDLLVDSPDHTFLLANGLVVSNSGKTTCIAAELAYHLTGDYPDWYPHELRLWPGELLRRPLRWRLLAPSLEKGINDNVWPTLCSFLPRSMIAEAMIARNSQGGITAVTLPTGAEISTQAYLQSVKIAAGSRWHGASFDEPPEKRELYIEILRGLIALQGRVSLGLTVVDSSVPWLDKRFVRNGGRFDKLPMIGALSPVPAHFELSTLDNPYIDSGSKEHWLASMEDDEEADLRVYGRICGADRAVFKPWHDSLHICAPPALERDSKSRRPKGWTLYMACDPHDAKPPYMLWLVVWAPDGKGVSKKRVIAESFERPLTTIGAAVKRVKAMETELGMPRRRVIDPNFGPKRYGNTGLTVMQEWTRAGREIGWNVYFTKGNDNVEMGHALIRKWLVGTCEDGSPEFAVSENCPFLIDAMRYIRYNKDFSDIAKECAHQKHMSDALRYMALSLPSHVAEEDLDPLPAEEYVPDEVTGY